MGQYSLSQPGVKRCTEIVQQTALEGHRQVLDVMVPRVQQVMRQAKARIFRGETRSEGKIVSLFEPSTEVIRKGKAAKPTEFGKLVKLQEAESRRSRWTQQSLDVYRASSPLMPGFIPPRTRRRRRPKASSGFASPIAAARAPRASGSTRSDGFVTGSDGAPGARGASV